MKIQVLHPCEEYEIQLESITQLCGVNFEKKQYIIRSMSKYFSNTKYTAYEKAITDNIRVDGEVVGRKYFSLFHIKTREDLIAAIKMSKSSLMFQCITEKYTEFRCQNIIDLIAENLTQLYMELNSSLQENMKKIEIGYSSKSLMEIIQNSEVYGLGEMPLENLSNSELLDIYVDLLWELQRKSPEKYLIIIEDIDHLVSYPIYQNLIKKVKKFCSEFNVWFVFSESILGFVFIDNQVIRGINVINHCIFSFPELEHLITFIQNNYPCSMHLFPEDICEEIQMIVHSIGNEELSIYLRGNVLLKMIQGTLCIKTTVKSNINAVESAFIMS